MVDHTELRQFKDGKSFTFKDADSVPDWALKFCSPGFNAGPILNVPKGDPYGQPYTSQIARVGDEVSVNKAGDRWIVVAGDPSDVEVTGESTLPAQRTSASLEDLHKTGTLPIEEMNDDQVAQMAQRNLTAPSTAGHEAVQAEGGSDAAAAKDKAQPAPQPKADPKAAK